MMIYNFYIQFQIYIYSMFNVFIIISFKGSNVEDGGNFIEF